MKKITKLAIAAMITMTAVNADDWDSWSLDNSHLVKSFPTANADPVHYDENYVFEDYKKDYKKSKMFTHAIVIDGQVFAYASSEDIHSDQKTLWYILKRGDNSAYYNYKRGKSENFGTLYEPLKDHSFMVYEVNGRYMDKQMLIRFKAKQRKL